MTQPLISIRYIGKRPDYLDGTYGTRIVFVQGESRMVPADVAKKMLRHPDVYELGEDGAPVATLPPVKDKEEDVQDMRDALAHMDKDALTTYAHTHFQLKLDKRKDVGALRTQVTQLIDQYGVI